MEMNNKPRCIFHIPNNIDLKWPSGSQIRPIKMLDAFKNIGYDVDFVMGYGSKRKEQIERIKYNIKNGIKYDFLYSESSTMPTLLTEKHHFPTYPFLDFGFMKFCKKNKINIGLFYRDIHWKFPHYKNNVSLYKKLFALPMYKYDLKKYEELIDILYLASFEVNDYISVNIGKKTEELPPGLNDLIRCKIKRYDNKQQYLEILYVGGVGDLYDFEKLLKIINKKIYLKLTICCRKQEWENNKYRYEKYLNNRISIVHKSGKDLLQLYNSADIVSLFVMPSKYWNIAMPVKLFEYLGSCTPIIATKGSSSGEFVKKNNIGWTIDYDEESLSKLLDYIYNNQWILKEKSDNEKKILHYHTWEARAKKVANQLSLLKNNS